MEPFSSKSCLKKRAVSMLTYPNKNNKDNNKLELVQFHDDLISITTIIVLFYFITNFCNSFTEASQPKDDSSFL